MLQCDIITLRYKNAFCLAKQVLRPSDRQYLLMFPMGYSVKLSIFPFRAGEDDIYGYTTGTGNIGFWMPTFADGEYRNSQLCYQYELHFWFLDHRA